MKFQFKRQQFQADAARAVVDVFAGQPWGEGNRYVVDPGRDGGGTLVKDEIVGFRNAPIDRDILTDAVVLERIRKIQRAGRIKPSEKLEGRYNLTIEMETGVGKTYAYIKTIHELYKRYGWGKYVVVVPSVAVREGAFKTFQIAQDHFMEEYGTKIRAFIYNSSRLQEIDRFATENSIVVMIVNAQAFNAKGKDARRIRMELDDFQSRRPIDVIAGTNPILIIDEPQSVEGKQTKESLKEFRPLFTLRYSATHRRDSLYNMIYRLDALDAYNKRLVKKIAVKGVSSSGTLATSSYVYLESVDLSQRAAPTAKIRFDRKNKSGVRPKTAVADKGFDLYAQSGELDEYQNGFVVTEIDGRDNSIEFLNGLRLRVGEAIGDFNEEELRRIQIRETILTHIERERRLYPQGIKVLSLFFIDEVAKYRVYDEAGDARDGIYAKLFDEEYADVVAEELRTLLPDGPYEKYLRTISASETRAGYFSVDKKGKSVDGKIDKKEGVSDDVDAYDLIMKNKERLLELDPRQSPTRFVFSHSALREGWDNPNVFQICALKRSGSDVRKRQEVGRGLRLCVNNNGERMDENALGPDVHETNVLTVIANESYEDFVKALQKETAEALADRPRKVDASLFQGKELVDANGETRVVDADDATELYESLVQNGYVKRGELTDQFDADKERGAARFPEEFAGFAASLLDILDSVYNGRALAEDARRNNVELRLDDEKFHAKQFQELWDRIRPKSVYSVEFEESELIENAIRSLDQNLRVAKIYVDVETGELAEIKSKETLLEGSAFQKTRIERRDLSAPSAARRGVKYDLIGKLVEGTGLTRKAIAEILRGVAKETFDKFRTNPEDFVLKAASLINEQKASVVVQHIEYRILEEKYSSDIFMEPGLKGKLDVDAMKTKERHLYDHLVYDSKVERDFAAQLEIDPDVVVYVKLPRGFYISTPLGKYNPDWAIAFDEGTVKHIYFVAETKGSTESGRLRPAERSKIDCAKKHFEALNAPGVVYDVVDGYERLRELAESTKSFGARASDVF